MWFVNLIIHILIIGGFGIFLLTIYSVIDEERRIEKEPIGMITGIILGIITYIFAVNLLGFSPDFIFEIFGYVLDRSQSGYIRDIIENDLNWFIFIIFIVLGELTRRFVPSLFLIKNYVFFRFLILLTTFWIILFCHTYIMSFEYRYWVNINNFNVGLLPNLSFTLGGLIHLFLFQDEK